MTKTITLDGNIAGDIILFNEKDIEDDIDNVRGVGTIIENVYNSETQKYDKSVPYPFTVFGRTAVNMADTVSAIKDETGKYPSFVVTCRLNSFSEEGENQKGEIVDKTRLGLNVIAVGPSLRWHTAMVEEDEHADSGRSSRSTRGRSGRNSGGRRRGREEEPEEDIDDFDEEDDVVEEEEEKPRRSSRSSGSRTSRSSGSRTSRSSGSRTSRSGGGTRTSRTSRSSRSSGASRRSRGNYDD